MGTSGGSIVHVTWLEKGWEETRSFMNQVQTVVNYWMVNTSYSVGVSDTVADATTINTIQATLDEAKKKVDAIMARGQQGTCHKHAVYFYITFFSHSFLAGSVCLRIPIE